MHHPFLLKIKCKSISPSVIFSLLGVFLLLIPSSLFAREVVDTDPTPSTFTRVTASLVTVPEQFSALGTFAREYVVLPDISASTQLSFAGFFTPIINWWNGLWSTTEQVTREQVTGDKTQVTTDKAEQVTGDRAQVTKDKAEQKTSDKTQVTKTTPVAPPARAPQKTSDKKQVTGDRTQVIVERLPVRQAGATATRILSGVTEATLSERMAELNAQLRAEIQQAREDAQRSASSNFAALALTNRINTLSSVTLSSPTITSASITGGSITGASITGDISLGSGTFAGNLSAGGQLTLAGTATSTLAGDVNFGVGTLYVDSINNRIGIGTTSPTDTLSVNGPLFLANATPAATTNRLYSSSGLLYWNGTALGAGGGGSSAWATTTSQVSGRLINYSLNTTDIVTIGGTATTSAPFWFDPNTATGYFSGNVGIGTTSPYAKLSVVGQVVADYFTATSTTATSTFANHISIASGKEYRIGGIGVIKNSGTDNFFAGQYAGMANSSVATANTFVGSYAGYSNTASTADHGTFVGAYAGYSNVDGTGNTFIGKEAGYLNQSGNHNAFFGYQSGYNNTGSDNVFVGDNAGYSNTSGGGNVFVGGSAGSRNTIGVSNTFLGYQSGYNNTEGGNNIFLGRGSGYANITGTENIAIGRDAFVTATSSASNIAIGYTALNKTTSGANNNAIGRAALYSNTVGNSNNAFGYQAGFFNKNGDSNVLIGDFAGFGVLNNSYNNNTYVGALSGSSNTTGDNNIFLGYAAGESNTTGANNIVIGYDIDAPSATSANTLNIGNLIFGTGINGVDTTLSSGNIGIGTTSPYAKLSVVGEVVASYFTATSTTATSTFAGPVGIGDIAPSNLFQVSKGSTSNFTVNPTGNYTYVTAYGQSAGVFRATDSATAASNTWLYDGGGGSRGQIGTTRSVLEIYAGVVAGQSGGEQISVRSSGKIGIGTSTPNNKLDVYSTTKSAIGFSGASGDSYKWTIGMDVSNSGRFSIASSTALGTLDRFVIDGSGNVGIGTTSPYVKLSVVGEVVASHFTATSTTATSTFMGAVGIGTAAPVQLLELNTGSILLNRRPATQVSESTTFVGISDIDGTFGVDNPNGAIAFEVDSTGSQQIKFITHEYAGTYGTRMTIAKNGKVGIGTTTPVSTLSVQGSLCVRDTGSCGTTAGTIYASNITVQSTDLAENYPTKDPTLVAGEIVAIDTSGDALPGQVTRASVGSIPLGIVSTAPGLLLGQDVASSTPVALSGRVPVRVTLEGGDIAKGDRITISSTPGVGAKASATSSVTVAIALEDFTGTEASATGTILAFVNLAHDEASLKLEHLVSLTGSATDTADEDSFVSRFFARMRGWFADVGNGISDFFANRVHTKELCVGDSGGEETCITKAELDHLLQGQAAVSGSIPAPASESTPAPEPTVEAVVEPTQQVEETPVVEPTPDPIAQPETTPSSTWTPGVQVDEPAPEPSSEPVAESTPQADQITAQ